METNISQIEVALEIAMKAHKGQRDLDGMPVILHPLTVALKGNNESEIVAGLLHDVVEDTDWTFDDLLEAGIKPEVVDVLRLLTHSKDEPYMDYVQRIADSHNPIAINVKCNDLEHNLDRGRRGDHLKQVAKHTAALQLIHRNNGDESAAWDLLMDDPEEGKFWQAKFDFQIRELPIEQATAQAGVTVDEYMQFFHPDRIEK
ncbi:MAG: HD domain-containing protein [Muribaculaceae bacterium]|nr:HD domain-containing protein [Muribaculaceae bacterium]